MHDQCMQGTFFLCQRIFPEDIQCREKKMPFFMFLFYCEDCTIVVMYLCVENLDLDFP